LIQRDIAGEADMHFAELDRGADIDQFDGLASLNQVVQLLRGDGGDTHAWTPVC